MPLIVPVVEGPGDAEALPILLRKVLAHLHQNQIGVATAKNAHGCGNLERPGGLEKFVDYACRTPDCGGVLVVMDTDSITKCPKTIASVLAARIRAHGAAKPVAVVLAKTEYEVWLVSSIETIAGKAIKGSPGIVAGTVAPLACENVKNPKSWLERHFSRPQVYKETTHQAPMSACIDPSLASPRSRSFRRLVHAVSELTTAIRDGTKSITP